MNLSTLLWPALGAGLIYAANSMKGVPDIARGPMTVVGTLMVLKPVPFVQDKI